MSWLEVDENLLNDVEAEKVSEYRVPDSGIYGSEVLQAYLWKAGSGAIMFTLDLDTDVKNPDTKQTEKLQWVTCIKSGDEKGNKPTYTDKNGKERLLPGVISAIHLFEACGLDFAQETPEPEKVKNGDKQVEGKVFKAIRGKKFQACVRQYEDLYQGNINIKYDIENFLDTKGQNKDGVDMATKFKARIEKAPIKKLKKKASSGGAASQDQKEEVASSGW